MKIGFDNDLYIKKQTEKILERIDKFDGKLYLEFGGKLFDDYHASRVLPGFDVNGKAKLLQRLKDQAEIVFCINAGDIEKNKVRADLGITYDLDVLRLIDNLRGMGLYVGSVVITQYTEQYAADIFRQRLERRGIKTYVHRHTKGYPSEIELIVSDEGYGMNPYIETQRPLVVVTAPGPGSGKLATCLSQLYHEYRRGNMAGYAKFETFPIWNLPLKHPVNMAYEAATSDLNDINMIDPFHLEAYEKTAVNYNRDIDAFPIVKTILAKITGSKESYKSPTDMGVNMAGYAITDDEVCKQAACQEVIRRYYNAQCDYKKGSTTAEALQKNLMLMKQLELEPSDRKVVAAALEKEQKTGVPAAALELPDGTIITGKTTELMNNVSSMILNAVKQLGNISDEIRLISPIALEPILKLKSSILKELDPILNIEDVLAALSISAAMNPTAEVGMTKLRMLAGCEVHSTCMLTQADESVLKKLNINLTCEPVYPSKDLYYV
ncbi:MAG: DUF1846 domain-containing protein [Christensenella sp.]|uniref:DUF1846 domain-containing protein n=1 Tax=Christensenella sp. TaxID=1935934 RepID=UPI002B21F5A3|nr:DUF1846 domain-containing protein [Christensenella sp.]MEA5003589.1 DUF1846 domain-containing protein [Christensenella sp.]